MEHVHYHRVALEPAFDLMRASYRRQRFVPHAHAEYAIGVVEQGSAVLNHAHGTERHGEGMLIIIPPGLVHTGESDERTGFSYRMMYLPPCYLERAAALVGWHSPSPFFPRTAVTDDRLSRQVADVHEALESASRPADVLPQLVSVLAALVHAHAAERRHTRPEPRASLRTVRAFMEAEYLRPLTIRELAAVGSMSPSYLIRTFHRAFGLSPYMYVEQLRIQHARSLIERGVPLSTAALMSRFSDQSHLTRRFKRTYGITPGAFASRVGAAVRRQSSTRALVAGTAIR